MAVVLARVDERLIHGQVALSWLRTYPVNLVIAVDDESAKDTLKTMLLKMAVSGTVTCEVTTVSGAKELIEKNNNKQIFLCTKNPSVYKELLKQKQIVAKKIYNANKNIGYYNNKYLAIVLELDNSQNFIKRILKKILRPIYTRLMYRIEILIDAKIYDNNQRNKNND